MKVNKRKEVQIEKDEKCSCCGYTLIKKSAVYKVGKHYLCGTCMDVRREKAKDRNDK